MIISNDYVFGIVDKPYWWGYNKYYSYNYKEYKTRAAFGMTNIVILSEIKRK